MAKKSKNYYDILGVLPSASMAEVKRAYRVQARRHHPDLNPDDPGAGDRFKEIREAYDCLRDARQRTSYDHSIGFKNSIWAEHTDEEPSSEKEASERPSAAPADDKEEEEPLGPRSAAAKAAAEEMRQRIHRAEREGFGRSRASGEDRQQTSSRGTTSSTSSSRGKAKRSRGQPSSRAAGEKRKKSAYFASRSSNRAPPSPARRSNKGSDKRSQAFKRFLNWHHSQKVTVLLFAITTGLAITALLIDPDRSAFFAVLAVGLLIMRKLEEIRAVLKKTDQD